MLIEAEIMLPTNPEFKETPKNPLSASEPSDLKLETRLSYADEMALKLAFKNTARPDKKHPALALINKIPLLSGLISSVKDTDASISKLAQFNQHIPQVSQAANTASIATNITLAVVNFIRIPMLFIAAYLVGEKLPLTLSDRAEWLYSSVLLGLTITALAAPVTAPVIAFVFVGLGLGVSLVTMGKSIFQRYKLRSDLQDITNEIATKTNKLNELHQETVRLQKELSCTMLQDPDKATEIAKKLDALKVEFDHELELNGDKLQELYNKKFACEKKLKDLNLSALMLKGAGVILSGLAVAGLVLCLFIPPVGLTILAAASATGLFLIVSQLTLPLLKGWLSSKLATKDKVKDSVIGDKSSGENLSVHPSYTLEVRSPLQPVLDSSVDALSQLNQFADVPSVEPVLPPEEQKGDDDETPTTGSGFLSC